MMRSPRMVRHGNQSAVKGTRETAWRQSDFPDSPVRKAPHRLQRDGGAVRGGSILSFFLAAMICFNSTDGVRNSRRAALSHRRLILQMPGRVRRCLESHLQGVDVGATAKAVGRSINSSSINCLRLIVKSCIPSSEPMRIASAACGPAFQHQLLDHRTESHDLDRRYALHTGLIDLSSFWQGWPSCSSDRAAQSAVHLFGNRSRIRRWSWRRWRRGSSEDEVPRFGGVNGRHERLLVAHFPTSITSGLRAPRASCRS